VRTCVSDSFQDLACLTVVTLTPFARPRRNQSAAHNIAQYALEYSESMETAEIMEALTRKADGKILEVDRSQIFPQAPPGSPQVPKFTDRKQKVVVFPDVNAGDTVVYTFKRTSKPSFAGQFFNGGVFQRSLSFENARMNITLPKAMAAHGRMAAKRRRI